MELILRVWHSLLDGMVRSAQQPSSCRSDSSPFTPQKRPCAEDRKSTRLNSSHSQISYAVFCLKKKKKIETVKLFMIAGIFSAKIPHTSFPISDTIRYLFLLPTATPSSLSFLIPLHSLSVTRCT